MKTMIEYLDRQAFYDEFLPLIAEIECGRHYDPANDQHVAWLKRRIAALHDSGAKAIALYSEKREPMGFLLLLFDRGLDGVRCFGKKASIVMFGLFPAYRSMGHGERLLREAEDYIKKHGGECLYVNTYALNSRAIRYYVKQGFTPVAYHPGENGIDDKGQVYLYKELEDSNAQPDIGQVSPEAAPSASPDEPSM
jgi:ribosomal protein S18 acetylase RimI-like enzyme